MNCAEIEENLSGFVDRQVSRDVESHIEVHLSSCTSCRRSMEAEKAIKRLLRTRLRRVTCPGQVRRNILAAIGGIEAAPDERQGGEQSGLGVLSMLLHRLRYSPLAASVVGMAVFVGIFSFVLVRMAVGRVGPYLDDIYRHHADAAAFPLQVETTDPARLAEWLRQEMGLSAVIPDLSGDAYLLKGGRECRLCKWPVAFVRYASGTTPLSLFLVDSAEVPITKLVKKCRGGCDLYVARRNGCSIVFWRCGEATAAVAAEVPMEDLLAIAERAAAVSRSRFSSASAGWRDP